MTFPDDEMEFRLEWTNCAGQSSTLEGIAALALGRAGELYSCRRDDAAEALRDFGLEIKRKALEKSEELQDYIEEDKRRSADFKAKGHVRK